MSEENTTSFYQRNKIIIWVLILIMLGIIIYLVLNKGSGDDPTIEPTPSNIVVSISPKDSVTVGVGYSTYLFAMVDSDPNASFSWKSSDTSVATVVNGTVIGIKSGKTIITATYIKDGKDYSVTKEVTVVEGNSKVKLNDISLPNGELYMPVNSEYKLNLILTPANALVDSKVFTSSDTSVATVTNEGLIKAKKEGHTVINVVVNGSFKKSISVYVGDYSSPKIIVGPETITINNKLMKIKVGSVSKLTYTVTPSNIDRSLLTWSSSDKNIVTIDKDGIVKGISKGNAVISITSINGKRDDINVEVTDNIVEISDITITKEKYNMEAGETDTIVAVVLPNNASNKVLSFTSSNSDIVSVIPNVDGESATISALSEGTATVKVKGGNIEKSVTIIVTGKTENNSQEESTEVLPTSIKVRSDKNNLAKTLEEAKKIGVSGVSTVSVTLREGVYKVKYCLNKIDASSPCTPIIDMYTTFPVTIPSGNIYVLRIKKYDANNNEISSTSPNYIDGVLNYYINTKGESETETKQYEITGAYFNSLYAKTYPLNINESVKVKLLNSNRHLLVCYTSGTSCTPNIKVTSSYNMKLTKTGMWRISIMEYDSNNNKIGNTETYYAYVK